MVYIRKLPSKKYQATVRMPNGDRKTKTHKLRSVVDKWGKEMEVRFASGDIRDPRAGEIKVSEWHERRVSARVIDTPTAKKNASLWRTHCEPKWGGWPMQSITRMEAQQWVNDLTETRRKRHRGKPVEEVDLDEVPFLSAATIHDIVHVLTGDYKAAIGEHPPIVLTNPFADLELPKRNARAIEFYERDEANALFEALELLSGKKWRTLVELGMDVGLRPGEIYGLHGHRVDWLRGLAHVTHVLTREGIREYPKSMMSNRSAPIPPHTLEGMSGLMRERPRDSIVFTAPGGGTINDSDFRMRVWYPAVEKAGIRRFSPRIMRHTAASWLVQDGVPLYDVQSLLGHESSVTTQRYAHLQPDAHAKVIESWGRRTDGSDARVTHNRKEARPS